jgi:hypothetical protein
MVTGEVKLNGTKYTFPVCFEEMTTGILQRIVTEWDLTKELGDRNYFKLFGIFTGTDFNDFHATAENEVTVYNCIKWFVEHTHTDPFLQNVWPKEMPKVLKVGESIISIPENVKALSIGANIHARQAAERSLTLYDENKQAIEYSCYAIVAAIYLQPEIDGKPFSFERAKQIEKDLLDMPAYLIRPIGFFLLANVLKYGRKPERHWHKTLTNPIKSLIKRWQSWRKLKDWQGSMTLTS